MDAGRAGAGGGVEMTYVIVFCAGALLGFLFAACCLIAGRDDDRNGRR